MVGYSGFFQIRFIVLLQYNKIQLGRHSGKHFVKGQKNVFVFAKIALPKMPAVKNNKICQLGSLFFKIVKFDVDLVTEKFS